MSQAPASQDASLYRVTQAYGLNFTYLAADTFIGPTLAEHGEFARLEVDLIGDYLDLRPGPRAYIDVGGNIGSIALPLAARRPDLGVVAIEANRHLAGVLAANAINNGLVNVEVVHAAAGAATGLARFPTPPITTRFNYGNLGLHHLKETRSEAVRVCTLDDITPAATRVIKIDVEGAEAEVLAGAGRVLSKVRPVWVLEANPNTREKGQACVDLLRGHGYQVFWLYTPFVTPRPHRGPPPSGLRFDLNLVAVPEGEPRLWDMPAVDSLLGEWPVKRDLHPYLRRYF